MEIRLSLASMLTALAVLAIPVASIRAQPAEPGPSAEAGAPQVDTPAEDEAPGVAAQPAKADVSLEANHELAGPSPERAAALGRVVQIRRARAVRRRALYEQRMILQANLALVALQERQLWLAHQASLVRTPEYSSSSSSSSSCSSSSSSSSSCSSPSQDTTVYYPSPSYSSPSYSTPVVASSQPASSSASNRTADEARNAHRTMEQRTR